jgi:hypothetical protein
MPCGSKKPDTYSTNSLAYLNSVSGRRKAVRGKKSETFHPFYEETFSRDD